MTVELGRGDDRPPRPAVLRLQFATLPIAPPSNDPRRKELPHLGLTAILADEASPPAGQDPLHWGLLRTLPVATLDKAMPAVAWYALRWLVGLSIRPQERLPGRAIAVGDGRAVAAGVGALCGGGIVMP